MNFFSKLYNKFFRVMQWNIGLAEGDIENIIRGKKNNLSINWLPVSDAVTSVADPFIFKAENGGLNILYEDFSMVDPAKYGTIRLVKLNKDLEVISNEQVLDTKSHLSYPFVFTENNKTYVIPESRQIGKVVCYEYDFETSSLVNRKIIIDNLPLLDSTILKYNNKYWLFATYGDHKFEHSKLYIYYADDLFGPFQPHKKNPVKYNLNGSRPGGSFITVDGELYRPAQNCEDYYGKSLVINKIKKLSETEFEEEMHLELTQQRESRFNGGIHTINVSDNIIVVDGIRMVFDPITKLKLFFKKRNGKPIG
ncbi:MAG: hypothetical protein QM791_08355 [Ferruginibacter sp.]